LATATFVATATDWETGVGDVVAATAGAAVAAVAISVSVIAA